MTNQPYIDFSNPYQITDTQLQMRLLLNKNDVVYIVRNSKYFGRDDIDVTVYSPKLQGWSYYFNNYNNEEKPFCLKNFYNVPLNCLKKYL